MSSLTVIVLVGIVAVSMVSVVALYFGRDIYTRWRSDEVEFHAPTNPPERNVSVSSSGGAAKIPSSANDDMNITKE